MSLSAQDINDIRADVGDANAFTDAEITRLYERFASAPSEYVRLEAVKAKMFEQLYANALKLHDYSAGAVSEKLSQVREALKERMEATRWAIEAAMGTKPQLVVGKIGKRLRDERTEPNA